MHTAILTDAFEVGGAEVALRTLISSTTSASVEVVGSSQTVLEFLSDLAPTHHVRGIGSHLPSADLVRLFRQMGPDVVHLNMNSAFSCRGGQLSAHLARIPVTATEHSPQFHGKTNGHAIFRKRIMSRWLAAHIAVGDRMGTEIETIAGLRTGSLITVYNGIQPTVASKSARVETGHSVIGTLGRLDKGKRIDLLIESLAYCPANTELRIIGSGSELANLEALVRELGLADRVKFIDPGFVGGARSQLPELDLFVMTSVLEGLPLVICEAALEGVPAVSTDVGSCREAIDHPVTGRLVPAQISAARLGAEITELLSDPVELSAMGQRAQAFVLDRFSPAQMAENYATIWRSIVSST